MRQERALTLAEELARRGERGGGPGLWASPTLHVEDLEDLTKRVPEEEEED
jgi:hypothetical protein